MKCMRARSFVDNKSCGRKALPGLTTCMEHADKITLVLRIQHITADITARDAEISDLKAQIRSMKND